ncbi:MAG: CinA family nicotinamide mononucleotide deamidase-related protein [Muribaculaceae bacterium]|nr:CinA family nicotinamide mononucleotide deamidase-related protein [Muribaculaceae bacterium]
MNYSIIVVGDEILIGQVQDTNSGFIARQLTPFGWQAVSIRTVADDGQAIFDAIDEGFAHSDVILMTGGLGPTKDDITKPTLCRYFGGELVHDEATAHNVEQIVSGRHLKLNDYTRAQAMVPSSCRVIQNQCGTAPLMWFERDGKVLVSMPGVPYETETMLVREVIPQLMTHFHHDVDIEFRHLMVTGIIESALAMTLDEWERRLPKGIHLAYLPQPGIIHLRLTGQAADKQWLTAEMDRLVAELHQLLGNHIVCDENLPLAGIVGNILRRRGLTLSTAESCTGGNIAHEITAIAGSSDYFVGSVVSYHRDVKQNQLGVSPSDIDQFGVVSQTVAEQMVTGVCRLLGTDCAVATTGVAGPGGGTPETPVGTVWMAAKCGEKVISQCKHIPGHRQRVIARATNDALLLLLSIISPNN